MQCESIITLNVAAEDDYYYDDDGLGWQKAKSTIAVGPASHEIAWIHGQKKKKEADLMSLVWRTKLL